jgi:hypothetical protein
LARGLEARSGDAVGLRFAHRAAQLLFDPTHPTPDALVYARITGWAGRVEG